jgi:hypothetical protein
MDMLNQTDATAPPVNAEPVKNGVGRDVLGR